MSFDGGASRPSFLYLHSWIWQELRSHRQQDLSDGIRDFKRRDI